MSLQLLASGAEFHELTLRLAGAICQALSPGSRAGRMPNSRDQKRIAVALQRIAADPAERLSLQELATGAGTTQYHFLRIFEQVVGVTPGQYILRTRLRKAAIQLRRSYAGILEIAVACGFTDLSTFNRQFRRWMGATPSAFRATTANRSSRTQQ